MPAVSEKQRRFMGAELARKRAGKRTKTGMNETQLEEYAKMPKDKKGNEMKKMAKNMPSHGTMLKNVAWGDVGVRRQAEAGKVGGFTDGPVVKTSGKI